jgi:hypothetical protein
MIRNLKLLRRVLSQQKKQARDYARKEREGKDVRLAGTELVIEPPKFDENGNLQVNFEECSPQAVQNAWPEPVWVAGQGHPQAYQAWWGAP